jgi:putative transposase
MRTSKFTEEQIVGLLREAEKGEQTIDTLCRVRGITVQTFYRWRKKFGGIEVSDVRHMRQLERENSQLKRLLAERELDIAALKALVRKK